MWRLKVLFAIIVAAVACNDTTGGDGKGTHEGTSPIQVDIVADRSPAYMQTATLSCTYKVISERLPAGRNDFVAEGHFAFANSFAFVSGDSSWVDTLKVNEVSNHQVVVRAVMRGDWLVDALVSSVIQENVTTIGGGDSVELHVK